MTTGADTRGVITTFYSYKGGTGRTMALANLAWLLASNGYRVLTIDWDLESPGLHRYFHPFLPDSDLRDSSGVIDLIQDYAGAVIRPADSGGVLGVEETAALAQIRPYVTSLEFPFPGGGGIDLVPAGRQDTGYSARVSTFDWVNFYDRLGGGAFLAALREDLRRHYDYVLIDSRTGLSDDAGICTIFMPDALVNCFTLNTQSIDGAVAVAKSVLKSRHEPIRIFPVPTRIEDAELAKLDRARGYARHRFEQAGIKLDGLDADAYWGSIEIPYKPYYAYEEVLAVFGDRPRHEGTLLAAYERLASAVFGFPCELPAAVPDRLRWLARFERWLPVDAVKLVISHVARDRIWAEWIAAELDRVGQPSTLLEVRAPLDPLVNADRALVLLSQEYARSKDAERVWRRGAGRDHPGPGRFLVPVRLDTATPPPPFGDRDVVDLNGVTVERARAALLAALDLPDLPEAAGLHHQSRGGPRFPATLPPVWKVAPRNPGFTGRDAILTELRDKLFAHPTARPVALTGLGGVGKTQIALEYAHRFAALYDIVWWISADQPAIVRAELARLAGPLKITATTTSEQVDEVLKALRQGARYPRWLIVFDNPDEPGPLREFLPEGPGDVIVTTRNTDWVRSAEDRIEVGVFDRAESVELMSRRVTSLSPADANAVAERRGDLPLVVEQAAAWLAQTAIPVRDYLELLSTRLDEVLAEAPSSDYPNSAAATWSLALDQLRSRRAAAARAMELFSCLSPEPIPTRLLSTPRMIDELAAIDPGMREPLLHGSLVRDIGRFALATVDTTINAIRVHRLVQAVVSGAMTTETRAERRSRMQEILAAAALPTRPGGVGSPENWSAFEDVRPHLVPSGALESTNTAVRQFVLDMVDYLRARSDYAGSEELAEQALRVWRSIFPADDPLTLRMRVYLANTVRDAGRTRESLRISEEVVAALTAAVGAGHPYTLQARNGLAADMSAFGRYREARELCRELLEKWRTELGDEHDRTLKAFNNLALAERLCGDYREAARIDQNMYRVRVRVMGETHWETLGSVTSYGRDLRDLGDYPASREWSRKAFDTFREKHGEAHRLTLRAAKSLSVTLRRLGEFDEAAELTEATLRRSEQVLGRQHPETPMCALEFACVQSARGQHSLAIAQAENVRRHFEENVGPNHPHTLAASNDLGIFLMRSGQMGKARLILTAAADGLADALGDDHPDTLICRVNLANALHGTGDAIDARRLDERTLRSLLDRFDQRHPVVIVAMANHAVSLRDTGSAVDAERNLQEALRLSRQVLGENHVTTHAIRDGQRTNLDIEPQVV